MYSKYLVSVLVILMIGFIPYQAFAQCFASAGNPVGGSANLGVMDQHALRVIAFYRYHTASRYFEGDELYEGTVGRLYGSANYNYLGTLIAFGLAPKLTTELETGYYLNKTTYDLTNKLSERGYGLSNALISLKYALYQNPDKHFEITGAAGVNLPYKREFQKVDGIQLSEDVQPSLAAYGLVFQSFMIKQNSFKSIRYFWINRFEKNFRNPKGIVYGSAFNSSLFFSRHFVFGQGALKDWTLITQLRYQEKWQNINRESGVTVAASGNRMLLFAPQVNCSINEKWNVSFLYEIPVYQYYHSIQLGADHAFLINVARDFNLTKKTVQQ
ncbi:MAG: hypothetical protein R6V49_09085 [Bacteroidales bacterium]